LEFAVYELLIFDWDGTIIDSEALIISCMQAAAEEVGVEAPQDETVRNIIGLGLPEAIMRIFPDADHVFVEKMRIAYAQRFMQADPTKTHLFPGVRETLERLQAKGYRLAVATGKSRRGLDRVFAETGLGALFEVSKCADETTSKPDPHMLDEIIWLTGVDRKKALMIGDTEYDLLMGNNAGIDTVAVSYGAHHIDRLTVLGPVKEIHHFPDLEKWLDGLVPAVSVKS